MALQKEPRAHIGPTSLRHREAQPRWPGLCKPKAQLQWHTPLNKATPPTPSQTVWGPSIEIQVLVGAVLTQTPVLVFRVDSVIALLHLSECEGFYSLTSLKSRWCHSQSSLGNKKERFRLSRVVCGDLIRGSANAQLSVLYHQLISV